MCSAMYVLMFHGMCCMCLEGQRLSKAYKTLYWNRDQEYWHQGTEWTNRNLLRALFFPPPKPLLFNLSFSPQLHFLPPPFHPLCSWNRPVRTIFYPVLFIPFDLLKSPFWYARSYIHTTVFSHGLFRCPEAWGNMFCETRLHCITFRKG
jgi:hypothetical protein